jgi:lambda family phage tail tape measure protein
MAATLTVDLNARIAQFETEMKRATGTLDKFGKRGDAVAVGLKSAFGALGAVLSVGALASFAKSGIDAADALNDMSKRTGVAVKDLASFQMIAEQSGTSLESVGKSIQKLSLSVGQAQNGNKEMAESLKRLGINATDPKERLYQLADAVKNNGTETKTLADIQKVLGKSYADNLPLLSEGADALRKSAAASETFAESMAKLAPDADKFNDNLAEMKMNAAGTAGAILGQLVPAMNEIYERIKLVKDLIGAGGLFNTLVTTAGTSDIGVVMSRIRKEIELTQGAIDNKNARGLDSSAFEQKLKGLNAQLQVLINNRVALLNAPPKSAPHGTGTLDLSSVSKARGGSKSDPLAGLLASTDIGKLKEFDKQVALLNQRFNYGKKDADLYAQAMTKLVESTFSNNFKQAADDAKEFDETQRLVADHLKETNDALYEQSQAWTEAGKSLEDDMRTPLENANIEFARLQELLDRGVISWETYSRAIFKVSESLEDSTKKLDEMDSFAKTAAKNIQNSFADFLFNPFENGLKGMAQSFGQMIQKMIADAVAADLARRLFGGLSDSGKTGGSGLLGGALDWLGGMLFPSANGNVFASGGISDYSGSVVNRPTLFPFASGIGLMGEAGAEAILPLKRGRDGKLGVASGGGGHTINVYVNGTNAPDVRRAAGQGAREALGMLNGARRYG